MKIPFTLICVLLFFTFQYASVEASIHDSEYDFYEMEDSIVISRYLGDDVSIVIPKEINGKPVVKISTMAFKNKGLTHVDIPGTVLEIGYEAFKGNSLSSVVIPNGVTEIGYSAFGDNKLTEVNIPSSVRRIMALAFDNNELEKVTFDEGIVEIHSEAFFDNRLTHVTLPTSLKTIGVNAFGGNYILQVTFKGSIKLEKQSLVLLEYADGIFTGWYTDAAFKNKWNNTVNGPLTIYANWKLAELAKNMKIENLSSQQVKLSNLEIGYNYTIYKDALLQQKLIDFEANSEDRIVTIKEIGKGAGVVYVVVSANGSSSLPEKIAYEAVRTTSLSKKNITVKYDKKQSIIQIKGLTIGTTYKIYKDPNQKVEIASFVATKTTKTIQTNKLTKKNSELYITAQQPNHRVSTLTIACYPLEHMCPNLTPPKGASIKKKSKDLVTYSYTKEITNGGKITEIDVVKEKNNEFTILLTGQDQKGNSFLASTSDNNKLSFTTFGINPSFSEEGFSDLRKIASDFKQLFTNQF